MRVAVPVTDGVVDGPGEGEVVRIYEVGSDVKLIEEYENPAKYAMAARGVHMLKSALERGAEAFIVAEIGPPGLRYLESKAKIYLGKGYPVELALERFMKGELPEIKEPTHGHHHERKVNRF